MSDVKDFPHANAKEAMSAILNHWTPRDYARWIGIDDAHIYRAKNGDITPTLERKLRELGIIPPPRHRTRFSGDTPLAPVIAAEARRMGKTNGEFLEYLMTLYW